MTEQRTGRRCKLNKEESEVQMERGSEGEKVTRNRDEAGKTQE